MNIKDVQKQIVYVHTKGTVNFRLFEEAWQCKRRFVWESIAINMSSVQDLQNDKIQYYIKWNLTFRGTDIFESNTKNISSKSMQIENLLLLLYPTFAMVKQHKGLWTIIQAIIQENTERQNLFSVFGSGWLWYYLEKCPGFAFL